MGLLLSLRARMLFVARLMRRLNSAMVAGGVCIIISCVVCSSGLF